MLSSTNGWARHWRGVLRLHPGPLSGPLRWPAHPRVLSHRHRTAEQSLRENAITIKGKDGKDRTVLIIGRIAIVLRKQLEHTQRGHKLLVPDDMHTDRAISLLQLFIMKHCAEIQDEGSDRPLTFHGLRHSYAAEKHKELVNSGIGPGRTLRRVPSPGP